MKVKLGELTKIKTGKLDANAASENGEYPFFTCSKEPLRISTYSYDCECVLVAGNGDLNAKYYNGKFDAYQRTYIIESNGDGRLYLPYLYYFMTRYIQELRKLSIGGVIKYIKLGNLTDARISLPSIKEQKDACEKLEKVKSIIDEKEAQISHLDSLVKARFDEMFGHPESNEKEWRMNTFGDICSVRQGLQIPIAKRLSEYEDGCYEYITVQYLHGSKEREYIKNPKNSVICTEDDILMTRTGNTGMIVTGVNGVFHNNFFLIDFDRNKYNKAFLVQYLNLDIIQADIVRRAGTSTIPDLNHGEFYKIKVFEPPMGLQKEFDKFVKQIDKSKFAVQKSLEKTQLLFDSLMQEYFG